MHCVAVVQQGAAVLQTGTCFANSECGLVVVLSTACRCLAVVHEVSCLIPGHISGQDAKMQASLCRENSAHLVTLYSLNFIRVI